MVVITDNGASIRIWQSHGQIHYLNKHNLGISVISVIENEVWIRLPWDGLKNNPLIIKCPYTETSVDGVTYGSADDLANAIVLFIQEQLNENLYEAQIIINNAGELTGTLQVAAQGGGFIDPTEYTIRLNEYSDTESCLVWTTNAGVKTNILAETAAGQFVVVNLGGPGNRNYNIPNAPTAYPVVLTFAIQATARGINDADWDFLRFQETLINVVVDDTTLIGSGIPGSPIRRYEETIQISNGILGTAETTGNKTYLDVLYNFTITGWRLSAEMTGAGNVSLKIDLTVGGVTLIGAGHTYPQISAVASPAIVTGNVADWDTKTLTAAQQMQVLVDSTTNTERWRLTLYGYRT